jgi:hypothetical protein
MEVRHTSFVEMNLFPEVPTADPTGCDSIDRLEVVVFLRRKSDDGLYGSRKRMDLSFSYGGSALVNLDGKIKRLPDLKYTTNEATRTSLCSESLC